MNIKKITYERLVNTGSFSHEKYGLEIEIADGETAQDAITAAKKFVDRQLTAPTQQERLIADKVHNFDEADDIPF